MTACLPLLRRAHHLNSLPFLMHAAEEKEPYESMANADKKRYKEAMAGYKSGAAPVVDVDSGDDSGSD